MEQNIVMQIVKDENPEEARFRKGDFLIGREDRLNTIITKNQSFLEKNYKLRVMTINDVENQKMSNTITSHTVISIDLNLKQSTKMLQSNIY